MLREFPRQRLRRRDEHRGIPQVAPRLHHPPRERERRLLDKSLDSESGAKLRANFLIAVASLWATRRNPNRDDRIMSRREIDRIGERSAILRARRDVMIRRNRGD